MPDEQSNEPTGGPDADFRPATPLEERAFEAGFVVGQHMIHNFPHEEHSDVKNVAYGLVGAFWGLIVREEIPIPKTPEEGREQIGVPVAFAKGFETAYALEHGEDPEDEGAPQPPQQNGTPPPPPKDDGVPMYI